MTWDKWQETRQGKLTSTRKCRPTRINNQYLIRWWNGSKCLKIASNSLCITKFLLSISWILWIEYHFARIFVGETVKIDSLNYSLFQSVNKIRLHFKYCFKNVWCVDRHLLWKFRVIKCGTTCALDIFKEANKPTMLGNNGFEFDKGMSREIGHAFAIYQNANKFSL